MVHVKDITNLAPFNLHNVNMNIIDIVNNLFVKKIKYIQKKRQNYIFTIMEHILYLSIFQYTSKNEKSYQTWIHRTDDMHIDNLVFLNIGSCSLDVLWSKIE